MNTWGDHSHTHRWGWYADRHSGEESGKQGERKGGPACEHVSYWAMTSVLRNVLQTCCSTISSERGGLQKVTLPETAITLQKVLIMQNNPRTPKNPVSTACNFHIFIDLKVHLIIPCTEILWMWVKEDEAPRQCWKAENVDLLKLC